MGFLRRLQEGRNNKQVRSSVWVEQGEGYLPAMDTKVTETLRP